MGFYDEESSEGFPGKTMQLIKVNYGCLLVWIKQYYGIKL